MSDPPGTAPEPVQHRLLVADLDTAGQLPVTGTMLLFILVTFILQQSSQVEKDGGTEQSVPLNRRPIRRFGKMVDVCRELQGGTISAAPHALANRRVAVAKPDTLFFDPFPVLSSWVALMTAHPTLAWCRQTCGVDTLCYSTAKFNDQCGDQSEGGEVVQKSKDWAHGIYS